MGLYGDRTYSQHGEDMVLVNLLKNMGAERPSFLDLGAHDPVVDSNTALLYERGSRGTNVELNPLCFERFPPVRTGDLNLNLGVAAVDCYRNFHVFEERAGINGCSPEEVARNVATGHPVKSSHRVKLVGIDRIFTEHLHGKWPEFVSTDLEGLDREVLASMDLVSSRPLVICSEIRHHEEDDVLELMRCKGYSCLMRVVSNLIFFDHYRERGPRG